MIIAARIRGTDKFKVKCVWCCRDVNSNIYSVIVYRRPIFKHDFFMF